MRRITIALLLTLLLLQSIPISLSYSAPSVSVKAYSPVEPLAAVNVSVPVTETVVLLYKNGTLYQTTNTSVQYGGVLVYGLPGYATVEFWLGSTRIAVYQADSSGTVTAVLPEGNYTVKVYPPAYNPDNAMIVLNITNPSTYMYLNWSQLLASAGLSQDYKPREIRSVTGWGLVNGTLYLYQPNTTVTIYITRDPVVLPPKPWSDNTQVLNITAQDMLSGTTWVANVFDAYTNGTLYVNDTSSAQGGKYIDLASVSANLTYTIMVRPGRAINDQAAVIVAYDNSSVYVVRLGAGADTLVVERYPIGGGGPRVLVSVASALIDTWYNVTIKVTNQTLYVSLNNGAKLVWNIPDGTRIAIGVLNNKAKPMYDFPTTITIYSGVVEARANYTVITVEPEVAPSANVSDYVISLPFNASFVWPSNYYAWVEAVIDGVVVWRGVAGNVTLAVNVSDGNRSIVFRILDPRDFRALKNLSLIVRVDAQPPEVHVYYLGVVGGYPVIRITAVDFVGLSASVNGSVLNVTGPGTYLLEVRLGRYYRVEVAAWDSQNRIDIDSIVFYAGPGFDGDPVGVPPDQVGSAIEGLVDQLTGPGAISFIVDYLNEYTWGLFGAAWIPTLLMAVWLKARSASLTFTVALALAWLGGPAWMALVAALSFAVLLYLAWGRAKQ